MNNTRIAGQASKGHLPSFRYEHVAPGYAACVTCGRTITMAQLAGERCPGGMTRDYEAVELAAEMVVA